MTNPKKIESNRKNALKSTGLKTEEAKTGRLKRLALTEAGIF